MWFCFLVGSVSVSCSFGFVLRSLGELGYQLGVGYGVYDRCFDVGSDR